MVTGVPHHEFLYFIADKDNKTISVADNGAIIKNSVPTPLPQNPIGWKELEIAYSTNQKYWSLNKAISASLKFVGDGATILRHYKYKGKGYEEELYVLILKWDKEDGVHKLEYLGKLDISKSVDDPKTGVTAASADGGLMSFVSANDAVNYPIECNDTNTEAVPILFDGVKLKDKYNYQFVPGEYDNGFANSYIPLVFLRNEGDSVGVIHGDSNYESFPTVSGAIGPQLSNSVNYILLATQSLSVRMYGSITVTGGDDTDFITMSLQPSSPPDSPGTNVPGGEIIPLTTIGTGTHTFDFDYTFDLPANTKLFAILWGTYFVIAENCKLYLEFTTINESSVAYGLRPLQTLKKLVSEMSNGRYTAESNFFTNNNNLCITSGNALRGLSESKAITNFQDWFASYNSVYNLGIKVVNNVLYVEPKADLYNDSTEVFNLAEVADLEILDAVEYFANVMKCGYPNQTYSERNGKFEFNTTFEFKLPVSSVKKEYNIVSKYRGDCFGIEFIRGKLNNKETTDDKGDNEIFFVLISDDQDGDGNYLLDRPVWDDLDGFYDEMPADGEGAPFNLPISPKNQLNAHKNFLSFLLFQQRNQKITFQAADKNRLVRTVLGTSIVDEDADVLVNKLGDPLALPYILKFKPKAPYSFATTMAAMAAGNIKLQFNGYDLYTLPIGELGCKIAEKDAGEWKLLASPLNNLETLYKLSDEPQFSEEYTDNMFKLSKSNPVHFVKYDYVLGSKYHHKEMFDDWVHNRFDELVSQPHYFQKWQKTETIRLRAITANLGLLNLKIYDSEANEIDSIDWTTASSPAVNTPYTLQKVDINLATFDEGQYIFVIYSGDTPIAISEWQDVKEDQPFTKVISYYHTENLPGIYFNSTPAWRPEIRVEMAILPWEPRSSAVDYSDESDNTELMSGLSSPKRNLAFGKKGGLPEWMALKLDEIFLLNRVKVENDYYTRLKADSQFEISKYPGEPFSYYTLEVKKQFNDHDLLINEVDVEKPAIVYAYTLDAQAFGAATGTIDIEITNP